MPSRMTLIEAAKSMDTQPAIGFVQKLVGGNPVLEVIPFKPLDNGKLVYSYNTEQVLPSVAYRGLNENYTASIGLVNPEHEVLKPLGGKSTTDRLLALADSSHRVRQDGMFIKSLGRTFAATFFEGDTISNKKEFDGLKTRLTGGQVIDASAAASGGDLATAAIVDKFEEMLDAVSPGDDDMTFIFMSRTQRRKLTKYARDNGLIQLDVQYEERQGRRVTRWDGKEIRVTDGDDDISQTKLLSEVEIDGAATNSDTTSIYCVRFDDDGEYCCGLRSDVGDNGVTIANLGQNPEKPEEVVTFFEFPHAITIARARAAARLRYLKTT